MFPGEKISREDYIIVLRQRYRQLRVGLKQDVLDGTARVDDDGKRLREMRLLRSIARLLRVNMKD